MFRASFSLQAYRQPRPLHTVLLSTALITALTTIVAGCASFDVTLNDQVVYTPVELYKEYQISDDGLRHCIERAIVQNRITKVEQLVELSCINAGIVSIEGLEHFTGLQYLDLTGNFELNCPQQEQLSSVQQLFLPEPCL